MSNHISTNKHFLTKFNIAAYNHGSKNLPENWVEFMNSDDSNNSNYGFYGIAFKNTLTSEYVVAFSGTNVTAYGMLSGNTFQDFQTNYELFINHDYKSSQYKKSASPFINTIINQINLVEGSYKNVDITLTGHSLGAALSDLLFFHLKFMGIENVKAVNFDNPGSKVLVEKYVDDMNLLLKQDLKINDFANDIEQNQSQETYVNTFNTQTGTTVIESIQPSNGWAGYIFGKFGSVIESLGLSGQIPLGKTITDFFNIHEFSNWYSHYKPSKDAIANITDDNFLNKTNNNIDIEHYEGVQTLYANLQDSKGVLLEDFNTFTDEIPSS